MIQDLVDSALARIKTLSFIFADATATYIDEQICGRSEGWYLFIPGPVGQSIIALWIGQDEPQAVAELTRQFDAHLKLIHGLTTEGRQMAQKELERAIQGYADSIDRFNVTYRGALSVETPEAGLAKLKIKAEGQLSGDFAEMLMKAIGGPGVDSAKKGFDSHAWDIDRFKSSAKRDW